MQKIQLLKKISIFVAQYQKKFYRQYGYHTKDMGYGMKKKYDYLLVGAGLFNSVFAQQAKMHGKRCLVIDKRAHLGGNVYCKDIEGITVHQYGPHIFHTNKKEVWDYVNFFVPFNRFTLNTIAYYKRKMFNLPFNMNTFYQRWGLTTLEEARYKINQQVRASTSHNVPSNLEEQAVALVGKDLYETLIKGYTEKQWGRPCSKLPSFIIKRLPVRFTFDNNYFNDQYQGIPKGGYNKLVNALLEGIECKVNCDYFRDKAYLDSIAGTVVYSGCIDEYFGYSLGHLDYRSLRFESQIVNVRHCQPTAIVNYTDKDIPYTRTVEHKYFDTGNMKVEQAPLTVLTKEYPASKNSCNEPYYPINDNKNTLLAQAYHAKVSTQSNLIIGGRLAEYKYYDMDEVVGHSLDTFSTLTPQITII